MENNLAVIERRSLLLTLSGLQTFPYAGVPQDMTNGFRDLCSSGILRTAE
jgi:hypothetical protein